jgi:hypothetical protein
MSFEHNNWRERLREIGQKMALEKKEASQKKTSGNESPEKEEQIERKIVEEQNIVRQGLKHVNLSGKWKWSEEPFPAFRCELVFGRNKRARSFLPVKDIVPQVRYQVIREFKIVLGESYERDEAEKMMKQYKEADEVKWHSYQLREFPPELAQGQFRVIKTKEKGTILVVPGIESSDRALFFVGCEGGFRGSVSLVKEASEANILKTCHAGNACESQIEVAALMNRGESVVFHSYGRRKNDFIQYLWDGKDIQKSVYTKGEWEARKNVAGVEEEDYEAL